MLIKSIIVGTGGIGWTFMGKRRDGNILYLDPSSSYTGVYISNSQGVHLRFVCFTLCLSQNMEIKNYTIDKNSKVL